jgi:hypothetical protein
LLWDGKPVPGAPANDPRDFAPKLGRAALLRGLGWLDCGEADQQIGPTRFRDCTEAQPLCEVFRQGVAASCTGGYGRCFRKKFRKFPDMIPSISAFL